jgi:hypothetical protein
MRTRILLSLASLLLAVTALGAGTSGYGLSVLVDGAPRPEYFHNGTLYVEALRGSSYSLRITNPTPYRVAVALSVDGLNTIDARHTDARGATKWVLEPYESTEIAGWQINDRTARGFFFTGERNSYGAALGQTQNLGVIEAVFFRERRPRYSEYAPPPRVRPEAADSEMGATGGAPAQPAPPPAKAQKNEGLSDEYAATGMGHRERHDVESVDIDLESQPAASVRIRYEFTPQLVKMGILPSPSPMDRRERARGFGSYCPEP